MPRLKAKDTDPARSAVRCAALGAEEHGAVAQRDTYFQGPRGRLKLREEVGGARLFAYERLHVEGREPRQWHFGVSQPDVLLTAFSTSLGVEAIVAKQRRLFTWEGVRICLDEVEELGNFLVLEAEAETGSDSRVKSAMQRALCKTLGIEETELIEERYCDLALARAPDHSRATADLTQDADATASPPGVCSLPEPGDSRLESDGEDGDAHAPPVCLQLGRR
jgi:predicted adenylyl cyclase CyaB